jgi:hypothetical protein
MDELQLEHPFMGVPAPREHQLGARNRAQTAKSQQLRFTCFPEKLQEALEQPARQAQRIAKTFGVVLPAPKPRKCQARTIPVESQFTTLLIANYLIPT